MVKTPLITFSWGWNYFPIPFGADPPFPHPAALLRGVREGQSRGWAPARSPWRSRLHLRLYDGGWGRPEPCRSGARWQGRARDSPGSAGRWRPAPAGGCPEGTARLQWSSCTPYRPPAAQRARGGHGGDSGSAAGPRRQKKIPFGGISCRLSCRPEQALRAFTLVLN